MSETIFLTCWKLKNFFNGSQNTKIGENSQELSCLLQDNNPSLFFSLWGGRVRVLGFFLFSMSSNQVPNIFSTSSSPSSQ
jgi:hypothetical protein